MHHSFSRLSVLIWLMFCSCSNTSKLIYLNDAQTSSYSTQRVSEPLIQKDDLLSIHVNSLNPDASTIFNAPNFSASGIHATTAIGNVTPAGYLVDQSGMIYFPMLGQIKAAGITKSQLGTTITSALIQKKLLIDPIVHIRFMNFRVSVLGEVNKPGVYVVPNEKLSIMEALGLAGDITIYGRKENILIIREIEDGQKKLQRLNLHSKDVLNSPYYYLRSNDIVYVEPSQNKVQRERNQFLFPILISMISLGIIVIDRVGF